MTVAPQSTAPMGTATKTPAGASSYDKTRVESGFAAVNGLEMYYEIHGSGEPLVTIHPAWGVANVFPSLIANRRLIAVELQGHGRTADIDRPYTFEQSAADVIALLDHLGIECADLFGESFGGIVAMSAALRHPGRVRRVAIYSSPRSFDESAYPHYLLDELAGVSAESESVSFQRAGFKRVAADPDRWPALFQMVHQVQWTGFTADELKSIDVPVLIGVGDHDMVRLEHMLEMLRLIPRAQLAVVPDAGHFVLNVDPEKFLPTVARFLDAPIDDRPFATPRTGYQPGRTR